MKIQGPASSQIQSSKSLKKGRAGNTFESLLNTEINDTRNDEAARQHQNMQKPAEPQWQLIEEVTSLLDRALEQVADGKRPTEETLNAIQQLRSQLQHTGEISDELHQIDTMLAVEAKRIDSLSH